MIALVPLNMMWRFTATEKQPYIWPKSYMHV